jgi:hypothetical protein
MVSGLLLLAVAAATTLLCVVATSKDNGKILQPWRPDCSTADNYTADSQYKINLDQLLAALPAAAGDNGWFYEGSAGAGADQVFGIIMCYADYNATECLDCLTRAPASITTFCPGSRNVSAMYSPCTLRYSDTPIPATANRTVLYIVYEATPGVSVSPEAVQAAWVPLMSNLTGGITTSPLRLATGTAPYSSSQEMYGLAQCTRDLDGAECSNCINSYIRLIGKYFNNYTEFPNNTVGVIKGYSCYLRYQVANKFNITLPPAPAPANPAPGSIPLAAPFLATIIEAVRNSCPTICASTPRIFIVFQDRDSHRRRVRRFHLFLDSPGLVHMAPPATAAKG